MIILFEKYLRNFGDYPTDALVDYLKISFKTYKTIVHKIAAWYYDNYDMNFLGTGKFGSAFLIDKNDNKVLKITTDIDEAANVSFLVKKTNVKGIVEYHDIHEFEVRIKNKKMTFYSIIMDRLYKLLNMERDIFIFILRYYFRNEDGDINLRDGDVPQISRNVIGCSFEQFKILNPNNIDSFIEEKKKDSYLRPYMFDINEAKRLANIYYDDIMDMIYTSLKYDLELSDINNENILRDENDHIKLIDVGNRSNKVYKNKSAKTIISL